MLRTDIDTSVFLLHWILFVSLSIACTEDVAALDGSSEDGAAGREFCEPVKASVISANGETKSFSVVCPVGAFCAASPYYCWCERAGMPSCEHSGLPLPEIEQRYLDNNPDYPRCRTQSDCLNGRCLFEPGCSNPQGFCCYTPTCLNDVVVSGSCPQCMTYCGCDAVTYEGLPEQPYLHPGDCSG